MHYRKVMFQLFIASSYYGIGFCQCIDIGGRAAPAAHRRDTDATISTILKAIVSTLKGS
jgi:hypothetical protein